MDLGGGGGALSRTPDGRDCAGASPSFDISPDMRRIKKCVRSIDR